MATATKQLEAIYQEITARFSGDGVITVTPVDGDPPEKYEITYNTTGVFKDDSGDIQEKNSHIITISIPFGFPHFPPSCKPKTQIFHPDFDPAAICIGDFWEKERSIGDLIFHIGQMISGNIYSTSNAFNEEASKWYQENSSRLPFESLEEESGRDDDDLLDDVSAGFESDSDDITLLLDDDKDDGGILNDFGLEPETKEEEVILPQIETEIPIETEDSNVDTLDESFLDTDFDYLGAEESDPETTDIVPPEIDFEQDGDTTGIDTDRFKLMARQKRFYELNAELSEFSEHQDFEGRDNLANQAGRAIDEARTLYNQGTDFEHQGSPGKALDAFKQVESIISDYPGLKDDIERTSQAKELLGDWTETPSEKPEETGGFGEKDTQTEKTLDETEEAKEEKTSRRFFNETARKSSKIIPFAIGIASLLIIITFVAYYFINSSTLKKAEKKLATCQSVLKQNRFAEAERQCEAALDISGKVQYFKSGARDKLIEEVNNILSSQTFTEGLKGNLLLDGKYLPKNIVKTITSFKYFMAEGDKYFGKEAWQKAASSYRQAIQLTTKREGVDPKLIFAVTENLKIAEFKVLFRSGSELVERQKWVLATDDLKKALELVKNLNIENKAEIVDSTTSKLAEIALATSKEEGDTAFSEGKWEEAYTHYRKALRSAEKSSVPGDQEITEQLNQLVVKAQLYNTINTGKTAFTDANWDTAIENYEQAIEILESNREILKQASTDVNRKKLARVMLQASIIRDKQEAAKYLKSNEYEKSIVKLKSIIDSISSSDFNKEVEFTAVVKNIEESISKAQTDKLLADKITYLEENFEELFTANYTVSSPEALTEQKVIFEKRLGDKLLFRLQCIEVGRGRPLKLVMKYIHDLKTGKWSFYSSTQ